MTDSSQTRLIGTITHSHGVSKHGLLRAASAVHQGVGKAAPEKGHCWTGRAAGCGQVDPALTPCCFLSTCQTRAAHNNTPLHKETVTLHRRNGAWKALPAAPWGSFLPGQRYGIAAAGPPPAPSFLTRSHEQQRGHLPKAAVGNAWTELTRRAGSDAAMGARSGAASDVLPGRPPAARSRLRPRPPALPAVRVTVGGHFPSADARERRLR